MPLYSYTCDNKKCKKSKMVLEYIVPLYLADSEIRCPKCDEPLRKMLSAPYFTIR